MRYYSSLFVMLAVTFVLGVVVGDNYAPISGATTRTVAIKCAELEAKIELLKTRVARLEQSSEDVRARMKLWLPAAEL